LFCEAFQGSDRRIASIKYDKAAVHFLLVKVVALFVMESLRFSQLFGQRISVSFGIKKML